MSATETRLYSLPWIKGSRFRNDRSNYLLHRSRKTSINYTHTITNNKGRRRKVTLLRRDFSFSFYFLFIPCHSFISGLTYASLPFYSLRPSPLFSLFSRLFYSQHDDVELAWSRRKTEKPFVRGSSGGIVVKWNQLLFPPTSKQLKGSHLHTYVCNHSFPNLAKTFPSCSSGAPLALSLF